MDRVVLVVICVYFLDVLINTVTRCVHTSFSAGISHPTPEQRERE